MRGILLSSAKLKELRNPQDFQQTRLNIESGKSWKAELQALAEKYNLTAVGSGMASLVFAVPNRNYVVKVFNINDTGYRSWLSFCQEHQDNPYVPKVLSPSMRVTSQLAAVKLEPLAEIKNPKQAQTLINALQYLGYLDIENPMPAKLPAGVDEDALQEIADFLAETDDILDLHVGNFMARGSQIILIDPLLG